MMDIRDTIGVTATLVPMQEGWYVKMEVDSSPAMTMHGPIPDEETAVKVASELVDSYFGMMARAKQSLLARSKLRL